MANLGVFFRHPLNLKKHTIFMKFKIMYWLKFARVKRQDPSISPTVTFYVKWLDPSLSLSKHVFLMSPSFGQFHIHFTRAFFVWKCFFCQNVTREKLRKAICMKNAHVKCWWNWPLNTCVNEMWQYVLKVPSRSRTRWGKTWWPVVDHSQLTR